MVKVELISVETDTEKKHTFATPMVFTLTFQCHEPIEDDLEFEVIYFGDSYSDCHNQRIGYFLIGPLEHGKQFFKIETTPIDLTKVPIKTLFGLTAILIVGKYHGNQFLRIGYVANVTYPGISEEKLLDSEDQQAVDESNEAGEEEVEVMDDEELEDEEGEEEGEEGDDEEDDLVDGEEEEGGDEDEEGDDGDEEGEEGDEQVDGEELTDEQVDEEDLTDEGDDNNDLVDMISPVLSGKHNREPTPLETPIEADKEEFTYKGYQMNKNKIEMSLMDKPIVHVFDIDWSDTKKDENIVESSSDEDEVTKKFKQGEEGDEITN